MSQSDWLEKCKRNDPQGQRALYHHFSPQLMGLCRRYARDRDDAKDMLQETFIKIFTKLHQLEDASKLEAWMKSIAVNTAITHYHRHKRREATGLQEKQEEIAGVDYELVLDHLSDEYLITLINALPAGCRMVFNLFVVEGYSHVEIAAMLSVTEGTSRSQLHLAKQLLKQKLEKLHITRYEKLA